VEGAAPGDEDPAVPPDVPPEEPAPCAKAEPVAAINMTTQSGIDAILPGIAGLHEQGGASQGAAR